MSKIRRSAGPSEANAGFSLLEVLIALAIIALVATIVGPRLFGQLDRSKVTAARVQLRALQSALETFRLDTGRYPTAEEGLALLVRSPGDPEENWAGPYLEGGLPDDPWGHPYVYEPPASSEQRPRLASLGADGKPGGTGLDADVVSANAADQSVARSSS